MFCGVVTTESPASVTTIVFATLSLLAQLFPRRITRFDELRVGDVDGPKSALVFDGLAVGETTLDETPMNPELVARGSCE